MSDFALSEAEFRTLYERVRRTSARGPGDRLGTLNNISPAEVVAAASDVACCLTSRGCAACRGWNR